MNDKKFIITGIQPLGRSGQRPEFSQATGMVLVRCILGKFLGVACHCFPPLFRRSHFSPPAASTSATTWQIPAAEVGTVGENVILPKWRLPRHLEIFYMPQICDMGPTALLPLRRKACWGFFALKNPTASAEFEPANLGAKGQHATPRPPKPLHCRYKRNIYLWYIYERSHWFRLRKRQTLEWLISRDSFKLW